MNIQQLAISAVLCLLPSRALADSQLTEADIIKLVKESPAVQGMKLGAQQAQLNSNQYSEKFGSQALTSVQHTDSNELPNFPGAPVFAPTSTYSVGVHKNFKGGVSASLTAFADQRSSTDGSIANLTKSSFDASLSIDLWKNFLGRQDDKQWQSLELQRKKQEIESEINVSAVSYDVRKTYWALIANRESQKLAKGLLGNAKRQLKETERRYKASVANVSDVSRLKAQVASRSNVLNSLKYQQTALEQHLRSVLPQLAGKPLNLAPVNLDSVILDVMQCTGNIQASSINPLNNTRYAELIDILDQKYEQDRALTSKYSDVDLKLLSTYKISGRSDNYSDSMQNINDETMTGFSMGLQLTVPLGGTKSASKKSLERLQRSSYDFEKRDLLARLKAQRVAISPQIELLYATVEGQKQNTKLLEKSARNIEKQYKQARISIIELIREQDALQDSQLKEIDAYLLVVNSLFDYLKLFQKTPCNLNV